ncbi:hypothetical protein ACFODL_03390 [Phenylobacterium terrae]|uniref:Uncharacterized protein n=1 Tax=Phenylobacterium terrae TaxID=2665495 RepID=A0ABW4MW14_9CAUL
MKALPFLAALAVLGAFPAQAQDLDWRFRTSPGHSHLVYGPEGSDVGDLWFRCRDASSRIVVAFNVERRIGVELRGTTYYDEAGRPAPWPVRVTVASGQHRAALSGQAHHDEAREASFITADFPMGGPVLSAFGRSGEFSASAFGETTSTPRAPAELVRQFLEACQP